MRMKTPGPANPTIQQVADLFSQPATIEEMNERLGIGLYRWEVAVIESYFPPSGRILDIGCGPGREAIALAQRGYDVVAVDISAAALERARTNAAEADVAVEFALVDGLQVPAGPFAVALLWVQVLGNMERREDQLALLQNCREALQPGAIVSASGHYEAYCRSVWGDQTDANWFYPTGSWEPGTLKYHMFTPESLAELLVEAGFEVLESGVPETSPPIVRAVGRKRTQEEE